MLKNIKSDFFLKKMISLIHKKTSTKIFKYNKNYQKLFDINLIDYKFISGRYIIYKTKNKGEEYNSYNDQLIYEGEYLNGKRSGKGKEYDEYHHEVSFDGEYLNGKRNGKGKEYNNDKLEYEGEYLNGKRNGKGKEYYNNKLIYEGEYLNGKKWTGTGYNYDGISYTIKDGKGFVKENYAYAGSYSDLKFEGEYANGERNGQGKEYYAEGNLRFEGEYLSGKRWNGKFYSKNNNTKIYEVKNGSGFIKEDEGILSGYFNGTYVNGTKNGMGYESDGIYLKYQGEYKNGKKNGFGKEYINGYLKYEGEFLNGEKNGKIKEYYKTNDNDVVLFDGEYLFNHRRRGKEYHDGILIYEGEYLFDRKWDGKIYDKNKKVIYEINNGNGKIIEYFGNVLENKFEGECIDGKKNGRGKEYGWGKFLLFEGEYKDGKKEGYGVQYNIIGQIIYKGKYLKDQKWDGKGIEYGDKGKINVEYKNGEKIEINDSCSTL